MALLERAGEIDLLESLEGGDVIGEPRSLMMFLGGFDVPECLAARRSVATPTDDALGRFGLLVSSTAWQDATKSLSALFSEATSVP